jgi:uncharacterized protein (DUF427 family)
MCRLSARRRTASRVRWLATIAVRRLRCDDCGATTVDYSEDDMTVVKALGETAVEVSGRKTESVWDYPRPPRLEPTDRHIRIVHRGVVLADTTHSFRVLETSHPPVYYLPQTGIGLDLLRRSSSRGSFCEFKGVAGYWDLVSGESDDMAVLVHDVAWSYTEPSSGFRAIAGYLAFYPGRVDECWVDGERVVAQEGDFYGGWITSDICGPFKGAPGTRGW